MGCPLLDVDYVALRCEDTSYWTKSLKKAQKKKKNNKQINRGTEQLATLKDDVKKGSALRIRWMDAHGDNKLSYNLAKD